MLHSRKHVNEILQTLDTSLDKIDDSGTMTRGFSKHGSVGADYRGSNLGAGMFTSLVHMIEIYFDTKQKNIVSKVLADNGQWITNNVSTDMSIIGDSLTRYLNGSGTPWIAK